MIMPKMASTTPLSHFSGPLSTLDKLLCINLDIYTQVCMLFSPPYIPLHRECQYSIQWSILMLYTVVLNILMEIGQPYTVSFCESLWTALYAVAKEMWLIMYNYDLFQSEGIFHAMWLFLNVERLRPIVWLRSTY